MIHIRFYLHTPKKAKSPLYCRVHSNGTAINPVTIGESLVPDRFDEVKKKMIMGEWDHEAQRVRAKHQWAPELNAKLQRIKLEVGQQFREMVERGDTPTSDDLRRIINPAKVEKKKAGPVLVREYYEAWGEWYKAKKNRGNKTEDKKGGHYVRGFKQIVEKVHEWRPKAKLKDFLPDFKRPNQEGLIEEFEDWVLNKYELQENTVVRYRKMFRVLFKYAGMPSDWLEVGSANSNEKFALEWSEVVKLANTTYKKPHIQKSAAVGVMISQLALRWGDFSTIKKEHITKVQSFQHGSVLVVNKGQAKTGGRAVYVPFPPLARKLFDQYGEIPLTTTARHKFSKYLKDAAEEAGLTRKVRVTKTYNGTVKEEWLPVHEVITPHILRHTGATLIDAITKGRDKFLVKTLLGHTVNDATSGYVHGNPIVAVDDLLDAWAQIEKKPETPNQ